MSHLGLLCPPYLGHINPMLALTAALRARRNDVTWFGLSDLVKRVSGAAFVAVATGSHPAGTLPRLTRHMAAPRGIGLLRVIQDMVGLTEALCRELPALLQRSGIDALVCDQLEPAGGLAAEALGLPYVSVANALPIDREPGLPPPFTAWNYDGSSWGLQRNLGGYRVADWIMRGQGRVIARWAARFGLPPRHRMDECLSPYAQITQIVPGLDFPRQHRSDTVHACGPLRGPDEIETPLDGIRDDGRPLVFASLGTLQGGRREVFEVIAEVCNALGLQLVLAHGGRLTEAQASTLPGHPVVHAFVPQRAVLRRAALAITNGGLNTVLDALAAGVPVVTVPIAFEQGAIAARVVRAGAGATVPLRRLSPDRLGQTVRDVLSDPRFAAAARRLAGEIAAAGGVERAADVIERVVATRRPVLRADLAPQSPAFVGLSE